MRLAIATVCLSGTLDEKLQAISKAGFDAVEIFENDLLSFSGTPSDVRRMAADLGLAVAVYQPFRDFEGMPEPQRQKVFSRAEPARKRSLKISSDMRPSKSIAANASVKSPTGSSPWPGKQR